jgi:hypothetical protein
MDFSQADSIDPNSLLAGVDYVFSKKLPLMPHPDPPGDKVKEMLGKMKWLKMEVPFRVGEKREFKTGTWYTVTQIGATELPEPMWLNRNALCGALLLPIVSTKEVSTDA